MKLSFNDILDKEAGKSAVVIGLGPSLEPHINKIQNLPKDKYILIGCNSIDRFVDIEVDYWVWANSEDTIEKTYDRLNS